MDGSMEFDYSTVEEAAKELYIRALTILPPDVREAIRRARHRETQETAQRIFDIILKNIDIADTRRTLICQDTGIPVFSVVIGSEYPWNGSEIEARLRRGTERATAEFPFRSSTTHPITRENPQTSTGRRLPVLFVEFAEGIDSLDILMMPKGSGSENMSAMKMFNPADGVAALKRFVVETVFESGAKPCPPGIIGVGVGGTADLVNHLAKRAIMRPVGERNDDPELAAMEMELEDAIDDLGIGPMGLGGDVTTLAVHIEAAYTHITLNPVAVNTQCWAARRARATISPDGSVSYGY